MEERLKINIAELKELRSMDAFCAVLAKKVIKRGRGQNSETYSEDSHQASWITWKEKKEEKEKGKKEIWIVRSRMNS